MSGFSLHKKGLGGGDDITEAAGLALDSAACGPGAFCSCWRTALRSDMCFACLGGVDLWFAVVNDGGLADTLYHGACGAEGAVKATR